ncbi:MAG: glycosyltransferase family 4 protein [Flavobacterium sp.]|nr:glycosyltransferase family 4 protein [Flavobacterium sp.]
MHICYISHEYPLSNRPPAGGVGTFVQTVGRELTKSGHKVTVIGMNHTDAYEKFDDNGVQVRFLSFKKVAGLTWWYNARMINREIKRVHGQHPIDIVETPELGLAFLRKIKGIKYVIRLHGGHHFFAESEQRRINKWKGFQEKKSFAKADGFIAVSEYVKTHTQKYLDFHGKPVELIRYPIDVDFFSPQPVALVPFRIVFAGTVCEKKGVRQLIQAFPAIIEQFPQATLEIFGRDWLFPDGRSYIDYLKKSELATMGDTANSITFHGAVNRTDLRAAYASAAVCVFPSHMETQGLVAPEAMAIEKVVVFTMLGPGPETIIPHETGLLCDPYNVEDIAKQLKWVFDHPSKVSEIEKNARKAILHTYSVSQITKCNLRFYCLLIKYPIVHS